MFSLQFWNVEILLHFNFAFCQEFYRYSPGL